MRLKALKMRLFLTTILLWLGTASFSYAISPLTVDIKPFGDGFVMARQDGMLIWTDIDGAGIDSIRLKIDIAGIEVSGDMILAVSPDCCIMRVERNGKSRQLCRSQIKNNIDHVVGIASTKDNTLVLTEYGVILSTTDFDTFTALDFNGTYTFYYEETRFCSISASDNSYFIAGTYRNGMPAVYTSATGKIWSERTLGYTEGGESLQLEQQPLRLTYDRRNDRFVMACTDGYLFYMPGCSHCNAIERKSMQDITAVAFNSGYCLFR
jgi:hypothetical protein